MIDGAWFKALIWYIWIKKTKKKQKKTKTDNVYKTAAGQLGRCVNLYECF